MLVSRPSAQKTKSPSSDEPEGIPQERVDPAILYLLNQLFPGQRGIVFLAQLLRQAVTKQLALPELGLPEATDVAVITVQSLRVLAKLIGFSYDTTEKYIVVLTQLRLLSKKRFRSQIVLHFPLCQYHLPEPDVLDSLVGYRPKVQSFARQVKRRFVLIRRNGQLTPTISVSPTNSSSPSLSHVASSILNDIRQIVEAEVDSDTASRLYSNIACAIRTRCSGDASRHSDNTVDSQHALADGQSRQLGATVDSFEAPGVHQSRQSRKTGDSLPQQTNQQSRHSRKTGDSTSDQEVRSSRQFAKIGDSFPDQPPNERRLSPPKGDSERPFPSKKSRLSAPQEADEHVQATREECGKENPNVNVISVIQKLNVNVGDVASYLCQVFGENPKKQGYYKNLYNTQKCTNTDAWLTATIVTLQAISRKRADVVRNPGAYFCRLCVQFHREGVPDALLQMAHQYGNLSNPDLQQRFQQAPASSAVVTSGPSQVHHPRSAEGQMILHLERLSKEIRALSRNDFDRVTTHIKSNKHTRRMRYLPYRQADGSILLLVEDYLGRQRWIWSYEEWLCGSATVQNSVWPTPMKKSSCGNYNEPTERSS